MLFYIGFSLVLGILFLIIYSILQWQNIPAGNLVDWLIGIASFWWLVAIVTIPWNIYFDAQEVIAEAAISTEKEIPVDAKQVDYARKIARWAIFVAIALHVISALVLYSLAATGISVVGYVGSVATILLTALRPATRAYKYLLTRLTMIRQQIKYPREDIVELRGRFGALETKVASLEQQLDVNKSESFAATQLRNAEDTRTEIARLRAAIEQFKANNELEHDRLSREAKNTISQLTEDSQFLGHVREIIRFIKGGLGFFKH